ncbi:hypothetical protein G8C92_25890 [Paenibacillus donghaensis]|uniref:hypothetical protein n=1 Tax=Paenibacillus donghaensis TaxID=414771 RepID=UPI001883A874|nr:hypothetical protein [Paenibacillus donghaensis]MBE9917449.1 hypothetical protein [Paenibacillus donghaensis]
MLKKLRFFFNVLSKIDRFLREPFIFGLNGFLSIAFIILIIGVVGMKVDDLFGFNFFIKQTSFYFGSFFYVLIPYIFFKEQNLRRYIIFGKKEKIEEISKRFDSRGYATFVLFFAYFSLIPILGIPMLLRIFELNVVSDYLSTNSIVITYILISITSIIWFSYHIVKYNVDLQEIKVKVAQYIAVVSIFTLLKVKDLEQFTVAASCLVVSYLWIQYIIELRIKEEISEGHPEKAITTHNKIFTRRVGIRRPLARKRRYPRSRIKRTTLRD